MAQKSRTSNKSNVKLKKNGQKRKFKLLSNPHGNVQRCPQNPQEKRSTSTGKEIKTPKWNKRIKRKWPKMKKERSQGLFKRDQRCYEPQEKQIKARMKL